MLCLDLKLVDGKWAKHFNISAVLPTQFWWNRTVFLRKTAVP